jgi:hypothetical protein
MSTHVFLCYAREDEEFVLKLAAQLKERGVPIWLDHWSIPRGANWPRAIENAIYECAQFLIVLSPTAIQSDRVQGEWLTALEQFTKIAARLASRVDAAGHAHDRQGEEWLQVRPESGVPNNR